jgi:DNA-binding GntR family transcriptional regulator
VQKIERPQSLTELAYAELRSTILSGELAAGLRLSVVSLAAEMGKADLEFHQRIQLRCGNDCLAEHLNRVQARVILATYSTAWSTDQHQAVAEHSAILSALRSGDAEAAGRAATTHLDNVATRIRAEWRRREQPA